MREMTCRCGEPAQWVEMPPESPHAWRVRCPICDKTVKWGGKAEFERMLEAESEETVFTLKEQDAPPHDPFAQFYK